MVKTYGLVKRARKTAKHGFIYYVRFRDPVTMERLPAISTGTSDREKAINFALEYLKSGKQKSEP